MKPTRKLSSYVLLVGVMGLSIVGGLVAYQVFSASTKSQITEEQTNAIKPLDGVINQATLDSLKERTVYTNEQLNQVIVITPTPEATDTAPEATDTAILQI